MANENLKDALRDAGLTLEQFADIVEVDPKTVQRWVNGRTPYTRHREKISRALDLPEHELWPDEVPAPTCQTDPRARVGEITGSWPHPDHDRAADPTDLLADPAQQVDILDPDRHLLADPGLRTALRHQATAHGATVRALAPAAAREAAALTGQDQIEIRNTPTGTNALALIRVDDTILLTLPLTTRDQPPIIRVQRQEDDGLFDQLIEHFDNLWIQAAEQPDRPQPVPTQTTPAPPDKAPNGQPPRIWPGRRT